MLPLTTFFDLSFLVVAIEKYVSDYVFMFAGLRPEPTVTFLPRLVRAFVFVR